MFQKDVIATANNGQAVTSTGTATVEAKGCGQININSNLKTGQGGNLLEVTEFERQLILDMRKYFPPARWESLAAEIKEEKKKYE